MMSTPRVHEFVVRSRVPSLAAIDARMVFRIYAAAAGLAGFVLLLWGPMWFGVHLVAVEFGKAALTRVAGAVVVSAACCAAALATHSDRVTRRRALGWFAAAHAIIAFTIAVQYVVVWGGKLVDPISIVPLTLAVVLLYLWATANSDLRDFLPGVPGESRPVTSLFGPGPVPQEALRSRYEQQIREAAGQEERHRLARDLHDSIKQQIFVIHTAAATAEARFADDPRGARAAIDQVRSAAREAMTEMEVMLDQLRAVPLENAGLVESLKKQCEALGYRTGADVEFTVGTLPPNEGLPPGAQRALFRVAQEALANVGRHARAHHVKVSLGSATQTLELRVEDDGVGFEPDARRQGMGTANMQARAAEFGGMLSLTSGPGRGTTVRVGVPVLFGSWEAYRQRARSRAIMWGVIFAAQAFSLVMSGLDFAAPIAVIAAIGVARNLSAYVRIPRETAIAP